MVISEEMMEAVLNMGWPNGYLYFQSHKQAYSDKLWQEYVDGN